MFKNIKILIKNKNITNKNGLKLPSSNYGWFLRWLKKEMLVDDFIYNTQRKKYRKIKNT